MRDSGRRSLALMWIAGMGLMGGLLIRAAHQALSFTGLGTGMLPWLTFPFDVLALITLAALVIAHTGRVWLLVAVALLVIVVQAGMVKDLRDTELAPVPEWAGLILGIAVLITALGYRTARRRAESPPKIVW